MKLEVGFIDTGFLILPIKKLTFWGALSEEAWYPWVIVIEEFVTVHTKDEPMFFIAVQEFWEIDWFGICTSDGKTIEKKPP